MTEIATRTAESSKAVTPPEDSAAVPGRAFSITLTRSGDGWHCMLTSLAGDDCRCLGADLLGSTFGFPHWLNASPALSKSDQRALLRALISKLDFALTVAATRHGQ